MSKFLNVLGLIVAVWASIQGFAGELSPAVAAVLVIGGTSLSALNESLLKATDLGVVSWLAPIAGSLLAAVDAIGELGLQGQAVAKWILGLKIAASALTAASAKLKTTPNGSTLSIILIGSLALTACGAKEAKALRDTAIGLNKATTSIVEMHNEGLIADDNYKTLLLDIKDVTIAHKELVQLYRDLDSVTPENKSVVLAKIDAVTKAIGQMHNHTRIRDQTKQFAFDALIAGIRTNLAVIQTFVENVQTARKLPK